MTKDNIEKFFERYERFFAQSLDGKMDVNEISSLYAQEFIAASPVYLAGGSSEIAVIGSYFLPC